MLRRGKRFQPHMQRSGMWGQKERYKLQTMVYNAIYIRSSFQDFLIGFIFNPTWSVAECGAEIFCPFRGICKHQ
ncbi:hypothetical protein Barb7_00203 [Bacteroidales bacterium Barb7]|nr:hypothetical protein Barb7_00203 [Bacteroidales bacterium Barb7]